MLHIPNNQREQVLSVQHGINGCRKESQISEPADATIRKKPADLLHLSLCCACSRPVMALSGGSQGGEFTSAFGGSAEVHGRRASAAFDAK
jgi:hypothetical protein